jgi:hypothetical protein
MHGNENPSGRRKKHNSRILSMINRGRLLNWGRAGRPITYSKDMFERLSWRKNETQDEDMTNSTCSAMFAADNRIKTIHRVNCSSELSFICESEGKIFMN